jgi:hypothetical protein
LEELVGRLVGSQLAALACGRLGVLQYEAKAVAGLVGACATLWRFGIEAEAVEDKARSGAVAGLSAKFDPGSD